LAKLVTDTSAESRKVDKKTALALWDSAILPPASRKRRGVDDGDEDQTLKDDESQNIMNFTVITKRGNKQLVSNFSSLKRRNSLAAGATACHPLCICSGRPYKECSASR